MDHHHLRTFLCRVWQFLTPWRTPTVSQMASTLPLMLGIKSFELTDREFTVTNFEQLVELASAGIHGVFDPPIGQCRVASIEHVKATSGSEHEAVVFKIVTVPTSGEGTSPSVVGYVRCER